MFEIGVGFVHYCLYCNTLTKTHTHTHTHTHTQTDCYNPLPTLGLIKCIEEQVGISHYELTVYCCNYSVMTDKLS